mmetsp:Transcript_3348/g.10297  ORF Transcript_3348/g.10297 Transcript_3348/m.10297 type:complete len:262 (-) Transcript_3348:526-1311(-)
MDTFLSEENNESINTGLDPPIHFAYLAFAFAKSAVVIPTSSASLITSATSFNSLVNRFKMTSISISSRSFNLLRELFIAMTSSGSLNTVAPESEVANTIPFNCPADPSFMGIHSRPSLVTICERSANFFCAISLAISRKVFLNDFDVEDKFALICARCSDASFRIAPVATSTFMHLSISFFIACIFSSRHSRKLIVAFCNASTSSSSFTITSNISSHTVSIATKVVYTSTKLPALSVCPRFAPSKNIRTSLHPLKQPSKYP